MSWRAHFGRLCGDEGNHVSRRHYESLCLRGEFHRGDRMVERYLPRDSARASVPPPHHAESGPSATQNNHERNTSNNSLDNPVFPPTHTSILVEPHHALDCAIVRLAT